MEAEAIKHLFELGVQSQQSMLLPPATVALPKDWSVLSTEKLRPAPARHRRRFATTRLRDFLAYAQTRCTAERSAVFIDPDVSKVVAVVNHGHEMAPEWGDDTATLNLVHSPAFKALHSATQRELTQQQFIDLLEDWGSDGLATLDENGAEIMAPRAIASVRRVKIEAKATSTSEQGTMRAARSSMEEIEASGADDSLPAMLRLWAPIFEGLDHRHIYARVSVLTSAEKPRFALRLVAFDALLQAVAKEIEGAVRADMTTVPVFSGSSAFAG